MKGIVFQRRGSRAVLMKNGGAFVTALWRPEWKVGDVVTIPPPALQLRGLYALAACLVLMISLGAAGFRVYSQPTVLISVDVNPSLELGLNRFDRVVSVSAHNPESEALVQSTSLINRTYTNALGNLVANSALDQYLTDTSYLVFTVQAASAQKQAVLLDALEDIANAEVLPHHRGINAEYYAVDGQTVTAAHEHGVTAGKYLMLLELQQVAPDTDLSQYSHCSLEEIKGQITRCSGGGLDANSGNHGGRHHR